MRAFLRIALWIVSVFDFVLGVDFFFDTLPSYMHWSFGDYPDPKSPGRLAGVIVSASRFWGELAVLMMLWCALLILISLTQRELN